MKATLNPLSFCDSQGDLDATLVFVRLTGYIASLNSTHIAPLVKLDILRDVIKMIQGWCDISHFGVRSVKEEVNKRFTLPGRIKFRLNAFDSVRIIPLYDPENSTQNILSSYEHGSEAISKYKCFVYKLLYLSDQGEVIVFTIRSEIVGPMIEYPHHVCAEKIDGGDLAGLLGEEHPLLLDICIRRLISHAREAILRAAKRMNSMNHVSDALKIVLETARRKDLDAMIMLGIDKVSDCHSRSEIVDMFSEIARTAGRLPAERLEQLTEACKRLKFKSFGDLSSTLHLYPEDAMSIINTV